MVALGFYGLDSFTGGSGGYPVIIEDDIKSSTVTKSTMAFGCQLQVSCGEETWENWPYIDKAKYSSQPKSIHSLCRALVAGEEKGSSLPSG